MGIVKTISIILMLGLSASQIRLCISAPHSTLWDKDHQHPKPGPHNDFINSPENRQSTDWYSHDQGRIQEALLRTQRLLELQKAAKNVIFLMGDGMGVSTTSAARVYLAQSRGLTGDQAQLSWERMPHAAFSKTYTTDHMTADSAATATAMLCGEKTINDAVCVNQNVSLAECATQAGNHLKSILHHSIEEGKWTGVVTTARITHASPACTYAHSVERDWEADSDLPNDAKGVCPDIATQLIDDELNQNIRVILGGGRRSFLPTNESDPENPSQMGERDDGRNLIQEWQKIKKDSGLADHEFKYIDSQEEFDNIDEQSIQYLMGLFEYDHMQYEYNRTNDVKGEPSLADMVEKSINILSRSKNGYFLFVEGGRIDHAHHDGFAQRALNETVALSDAVQRALDLTREEDTLVVVSADHSHVFTMAGYPRSHVDILTYDEDASMVSDDGKPFATLGYTNGPGFRVHRMDESETIEQSRTNLSEIKQDMTSMDYVSDAGIWRESESHGGEDVAIFARGPMAHLFHGTQEQTYIANLMMYASCVGRNKDLCHNNVDVPLACSSQTSAGSGIINANVYLTTWTVILFALGALFL